jgi:hypothetical protein
LEQVRAPARFDRINTEGMMTSLATEPQLVATKSGVCSWS